MGTFAQELSPNSFELTPCGSRSPSMAATGLSYLECQFRLGTAADASRSAQPKTSQNTIPQKSAPKPKMSSNVRLGDQRRSYTRAETCACASTAFAALSLDSADCDAGIRSITLCIVAECRRQVRRATSGVRPLRRIGAVHRIGYWDEVSPLDSALTQMY